MTYNLVEIQKRQESTDKFVQKVGKTLWHYGKKRFGLAAQRM